MALAATPQPEASRRMANCPLTTRAIAEAAAHGADGHALAAVLDDAEIGRAHV